MLFLALHPTSKQPERDNKGQQWLFTWQTSRITWKASQLTHLCIAFSTGFSKVGRSVPRPAPRLTMGGTIPWAGVLYWKSGENKPSISPHPSASCCWLRCDKEHHTPATMHPHHEGSISNSEPKAAFLAINCLLQASCCSSKQLTQRLRMKTWTEWSLWTVTSVRVLLQNSSLRTSLRHSQ